MPELNPFNGDASGVYAKDSERRRVILHRLADESSSPVFVLATTAQEREAMATPGYDTICVPLRSSDTFKAGRLYNVAGRALTPWRWRRVMLNEQIRTVYVNGSIRSIPIVVAAVMSGCTVKGTHARSYGSALSRVAPSRYPRGNGEKGPAGSRVWREYFGWR